MREGRGERKKGITVEKGDSQKENCYFSKHANIEREALSK